MDINEKLPYFVFFLASTGHAPMKIPTNVISLYFTPPPTKRSHLHLKIVNLLAAWNNPMMHTCFVSCCFLPPKSFKIKDVFLNLHLYYAFIFRVFKLVTYVLL